uniref:Uncharacterized protein n=1 Tax=Arundo donax TaxID=35708 RepID=A0A0A9NRY0_ARUDO
MMHGDRARKSFQQSAFSTRKYVRNSSGDRCLMDV